MAILDDATLLTKKIAVTIIIYLVPVTILVGGLLLIQHALSDDNEAANKIEIKTSLTKPE